MTDPDRPRPTSFRSGGLSQRKPTRFAWAPGAEERASLAAELGLLAIYRLEFSGQIDPVGRDEFRLRGQLLGRIDQACVVTLAPVGADIREDVVRRYVAGLDQPSAEEVEIPEDDGIEPLPETLDIPEIAIEALMLALPLYPRAPGAEYRSPVEPGAAAADEDTPLKPFAGLAALAERLKSGPADDSDGGH